MKKRLSDFPAIENAKKKAEQKAEQLESKVGGVHINSFLT
jgi:hypothetical protein